MMPEFTSSQAAKAAGVAGSTLRRYIKQFGQHFSEKARKDRGRRYNRQDLLTIKKIRRLYSEGLNDTEIDERLPDVDDADFLDVLDFVSDDITKPARDAQQTALQVRDDFRRWSETWEGKQNVLADRQLDTEKRVNNLEGDYVSRDEYNQQLKRIEDEYSQRFDALQREWQEFQRLPWWRKIFTRKPPSPFE